MNSSSNSPEGPAEVELLTPVDFSTVDFIVPAAGHGLRMGANVCKQYMALMDKPVLQHTLEKLLLLEPRRLVLVVADGDKNWQDLPATRHCLVVTGGSTRADSVLNGLNVLAGSCSETQVTDAASDIACDISANDWVLVHDSVRPCVTLDHIRRLFSVVQESEIGGLLALPVSDTLKKVEKGNVLTEPRLAFWLAQTPQMFRFGLLHEALTQAQIRKENVTDEASAIELSGHNPVLVEGSRENLKITNPEDLALAEFYLSRQG